MSSIETPDYPALQQFAASTSIQESAKALRELLAAKALQKVAKRPTFRLGLQSLVRFASDTTDEVERLEAIAEIVRVAQSARALTEEIKEILTPLLNARLPSAHLLKDPDSRGYIAKACLWSQAPWTLSYAIESIATEDTAETARKEFVDVAFSRASNLSEIFSLLENAMAKIDFSTETPADSMAVRIIRILAALRIGLVVSRLPPGDNAGDRLSSMIRVSLSITGVTNKEDRAVLLAKEIILCTYELVRTRFSLSTDASTYEPLRTAKRLFLGSSWPLAVREELSLVAECIVEALLLLAKQGFMPASLVSHLELVAENKFKAESLLRHIADTHPELDEGVRSWLRKSNTSAVVSSRDALTASSELRLDPQLGQALIEAAQVSEDVEVVQVDVIGALRVYDPAQANVLEQHMGRMKTLLATIKDIGIRRRLTLYGDAGAVVEFAPKYFEQVGTAGGFTGRVLRSAIVRLDDDDRLGEVVVKGLVERY